MGPSLMGRPHTCFTGPRWASPASWKGSTIRGARSASLGVSGLMDVCGLRGGPGPPPVYAGDRALAAHVGGVGRGGGL